MSKSKYNLLFGEEDDNRIDVFIDAVSECIRSYKRRTNTQSYSIEDMGVFTNLDDMTFMHNSNGYGLNKNRRCDNNTIHYEWSFIISDIIVWVNSPVRSQDRLKLINDLLQITTSYDTRDYYIKQLMLIFYDIPPPRAIRRVLPDLNSNVFIKLFMTEHDSAAATAAARDVEAAGADAAAAAAVGVGRVVATEFLLSRRIPFYLPPRAPFLYTKDCLNTLNDFYTKIKGNIKHYSEAGKIVAYTRTIMKESLKSKYQNKGFLESIKRGDPFYIGSESTPSLLTSLSPDNLEFFNEHTSTVWKLNSDGNFVDRETNKVIDYQKMLEESSAKDSCKILPLNSAEPDEQRRHGFCAEAIQTCLNGRDIKKCTEKLHEVAGSNGGFKDEIRNTYPHILARLTVGLEIPTEEEFSTKYNKPILKLKSYESWLEVLRNKLQDPAQLQNIVGNKNLTAYIQYLITFINGNPSILNKDLLNKSSDRRNLSEYRRMGIKPFGSRGNFVKSDLIRLLQTVELNKVALMSHISQFGGILKGGGLKYNITDSYNSYINEPVNLYSIGVILEAQYSKIKTFLSDGNKTISHDNNKDIEAFIEQLKLNEEKLIKSLYYLTEYAKQINNNTSEEINLNQIKRIVDKTKNKIIKVNAGREQTIALLLDMLK